jgi:hypothetical protein
VHQVLAGSLGGRVPAGGSASFFFMTLPLAFRGSDPTVTSSADSL